MSTITLYIKPTCPFCVRAMSLLDEKQASYTVIDIAADPSRRPEMIEKANGRTTVPQIFIGDLHVGGCDDLMALNASGKLDALL